MGLFDFFISKEKQTATTPKRAEARAFNYNQGLTNDQNQAAKMQVFYPKSFDEVSEIINILSMGKPALVNVKDLRPETSQRVLDLLSGAIYALHGGLCEVDKGIYLFSIDGVQRN